MDKIPCFETIEKKYREDGKCIILKGQQTWKVIRKQCRGNAKYAERYCYPHAKHIWESCFWILKKSYRPDPNSDGDVKRYKNLLPILRELKKEFDPRGEIVRYQEKLDHEEDFKYIAHQLLHEDYVNSWNRNSFDVDEIKRILTGETDYSDRKALTIFKSNSLEQMGINDSFNGIQGKLDEIIELDNEIERLKILRDKKHGDCVSHIKSIGSKLKKPKRLQDIKPPFNVEC